MLNGVLVGFGIMLASLLIPIVHYVSAPLGPFIAGFIGGGVARIDQDGIIKFGVLTALLMFIPAAVVLILKFVVGVEKILIFPFTSPKAACRKFMSPLPSLLLMSSIPRDSVQMISLKLLETT